MQGRSDRPGLASPSRLVGFTRVVPGDAIVFGYETAAAFWAHLRSFDDASLRGCLDELYPTDMLRGMGREDMMRDASLAPISVPRLSAFRAEDAEMALRLSGPYEALVGSAKNRRTSKLLSFHVWRGAVPDGLLVRVARDMYVCSPELALLQLASGMSRIALLEYAFELCGSYAFPNGRGNLMCDGVRPVTTPERLALVSSLITDVRGLAKASFASRHVRAGARSPMEAQLAMLLGLPKVYGGFECGDYRMDYRIDLPPAARVLARRDYLVADIYVPGARTDVEYQGFAHHLAGGSARDDARTNALLSVGIQELSVWADQLYDLDAMAEIARVIRRSAGLKPKSESHRTREVRDRLCAELRASSLAGLV